jgi:uncharacterized membrane protein
MWNNPVNHLRRMSDFFKTLAVYCFVRGIGPVLIPAIVVALIIHHWRAVLVYGGIAFAIFFIASCISLYRGRRWTERYYATERERLAKVGLPQKMQQFTK